MKTPLFGLFPRASVVWGDALSQTGERDFKEFDAEPERENWESYTLYGCADDMNLFKLTDDVEEAVEEVAGFYRRYHSMRYVGARLVLRLLAPLPAAALERLNDTYAAAILTEGRIEQHPGPLEGEGEEAERPDLTRLSLTYNRRDAGLLRRMIDDINAA